MKISFKISEENYLDFQLYLASESAIVIQKKKWTRKIIPLIYLSIAVVMYFLEKLFLFACFGIIGKLWYFLYPWIEEKNTRKKYREIITSTFQDKINNDITLENDTENFIYTTRGNSTKVAIKSITEIIQLKTILIIKTNTNQAFVIPNQALKNLESHWIEFQRISSFYKIPFSKKLNWEW